MSFTHCLTTVLSVQTSLNKLRVLFYSLKFVREETQKSTRGEKMAGCHHTDTDGVVPDEMVFYYASALGPGVTVENIPPQRITVKYSESMDVTDLIDPFSMILCGGSFAPSVLKCSLF